MPVNTRVICSFSILFFRLSMPLRAQPDSAGMSGSQGENAPKGSWLALSAGKAFVRNEGERQYLALGVSYHIRFQSNLISLRLNALPYSGIEGEAFPFTLRLRFIELGALYGKVIDMPFGHLSFSGGIAGLLASPSFPGSIDFVTIGFPVEVQALATNSWAGIGLSLISNINPENTFAGLKMMVAFGDLRGVRETRSEVNEKPEDNPSPRNLRIVKSIGFGVLAAGAGAGGGSLLVGVTTHPHGEDAGLALLAGAALGAPILMPIGVHLGNESRGNLALDYLPLVGTGTAAILISGNAHDASPFVMLAIVDFAGTVLIEHLLGQ